MIIVPLLLQRRLFNFLLLGILNKNIQYIDILGEKIKVTVNDAHLTPYHKPHSTFVIKLHDHPGGGIQFINKGQIMYIYPGLY